MLQNENMTTSQAIVEGTAASILVSFMSSMLETLIPYTIVVLTTIVLDLYQGVRAAKKRGEKVRVSRAARRSISKLFEYCCWVLFAGSVRIATGSVWLFYIILVFPFVIELWSIIENYLFVHGKQITGLNLWKIFGGKLGVDLDDVKIEDIDKDE